MLQPANYMCAKITIMNLNYYKWALLCRSILKTFGQVNFYLVL